MTPRYSALQALASRSIPTDCDRQFPHPEFQERTLYVHPTDARALVEPTRDGNDYLRVCARHQWASDVIQRFADLEECPACLVEIAGAAGRKRYAALHAEGVRIIGLV